MILFDKSLRAWGTPQFETTLKREVAQLGADILPLQQGLITGNYVADTPITVVVNAVAETDNLIRIKAGIYYQSVIGGCSCTDDPTPSSDINEYCEVLVDIDKRTAAAVIALVQE